MTLLAGPATQHRVAHHQAVTLRRNARVTARTFSDKLKRLKLVRTTPAVNAVRLL